MRLGGGTPWWLVALSATFLAVMAGLLGASLLRPDPPPTFAPGGVREEGPDGVIRGRQTLDARDPDRWAFFSFRSVSEPEPVTWDLAARRFRVVVNGGEGYSGRGGARALGDVPVDSVGVVPVEGYVPTKGPLEGDPRHPVLEDWYRYAFLTHLLHARPVTYAVRTAEGGYAVLRILSYYCPGAEPGCLTFAYAWRPDGRRRLGPGRAAQPSF